MASFQCNSTLLLIGVALTIFTSVKFFPREKVVEIGKLEISRDKPNYLSWSPLPGVVVGIGGVLIWQNSRKNRRSPLF